MGIKMQQLFMSALPLGHPVQYSWCLIDIQSRAIGWGFLSLGSGLTSHLHAKVHMWSPEASSWHRRSRRGFWICSRLKPRCMWQKSSSCEKKSKKHGISLVNVDLETQPWGCQQGCRHELNTLWDNFYPHPRTNPTSPQRRHCSPRCPARCLLRGDNS